MLTLLALAAAAAQPDVMSPQGNWRNPKASVVIAIAPCGDALCGRVQWASDKAVADARRAGTDPLVGAELLSNFVPSGPGRWKGRLFVPDARKRTTAELLQLGPDQLKIKGCAVGKVLCKSQVWSRVEANGN